MCVYFFSLEIVRKKTGEKIKRKCGKIKRTTEMRRKDGKIVILIIKGHNKVRFGMCFVVYVQLCDGVTVNVCSCNDSNRLKCLPSFVECTSLIC